MIKLYSTYLSFSKLALELWLNETVALKISKSLLKLFQIDGIINVILFWPKLPFLKRLSKAICDLVLYGFWEEIKSSFT